MKTIKHIKERVTDFENLYLAYIHARKKKRFRREVLAFSANLEDNLHKIQMALINQTYVPGRYHKRVIHEPAERLIMWQDFEHRVVQWAVYQVLNPAFASGYIEDSFACISERGTDAAAQRLYQFMQQAGRKQKQAGLDAADRPRLRYWVQKLDTSKFFYRIDHQVSMDLIGRKCGYDSWLMWLMDLFVNAPNERFGLPPGLGVNDLEPEEMLTDKGLAVGSLTIKMRLTILPKGSCTSTIMFVIWTIL